MLYLNNEALAERMTRNAELGFYYSQQAMKLRHQADVCPDSRRSCLLRARRAEWRVVDCAISIELNLERLAERSSACTLAAFA